MPGVVDIWNMSLFRLGKQYSVSSVTEQSEAATTLRTFYDTAVTATLAANDWPFARTFTNLAQIGAPPPPWAYQYGKPADCVRVLSILNPYDTTPNTPGGVTGSLTQPWGYGQQVGLIPPASATPIPFKTGRGNDGQGGPFVGVIWTNQALAQCFYTAYVTDPNQWEPGFTDAMTWMLAATSAVALTGSASVQKAMLDGYAQSLAVARNTEGNEETLFYSYDADWLAGRDFVTANYPANLINTFGVQVPGPPGPAGADGVSPTEIAIVGNNLVITLSNGSTLSLNGIVLPGGLLGVPQP